MGRHCEMGSQGADEKARRYHSLTGPLTTVGVIRQEVVKYIPGMPGMFRL